MATRHDVFQFAIHTARHDLDHPYLALALRCKWLSVEEDDNGANDEIETYASVLNAFTAMAGQPERALSETCLRFQEGTAKRWFGEMIGCSYGLRWMENFIVPQETADLVSSIVEVTRR